MTHHHDSTQRPECGATDPDLGGSCELEAGHRGPHRSRTIAFRDGGHQEPTSVVDYAGDLWGRARDGRYYPIVIDGEHYPDAYGEGMQLRMIATEQQTRVPSYGIPMRVTTEEAERLEAEQRVVVAPRRLCDPAPADQEPVAGPPTPKPWAEGARPTAAQLHHWLADNRDQPAARGHLAALQALAWQGSRCQELGHEGDLTYLGTVLDELAAARIRIHRFEHGHPADLTDDGPPFTGPVTGWSYDPTREPGPLPTNPDQE